MIYTIEIPGLSTPHRLDSCQGSDVPKIARCLAVAPSAVSVLSPDGTPVPVSEAFSKPWFK